MKYKTMLITISVCVVLAAAALIVGVTITNANSYDDGYDSGLCTVMRCDR